MDAVPSAPSPFRKARRLEVVTFADCVSCFIGDLVLIVLLCFVGNDCHSLQQEDLGNLTEDLTLYGANSARGNRLRFSQVGWPGWGRPRHHSEFGHFPPNSPEGRIENSPAVHCRVESEIAQVPKGRPNPFISYVSSYSHCVFSFKALLCCSSGAASVSTKLRAAQRRQIPS